MNAKDIMSAPIIWVTPDMSVRDVARILVNNRISAVPVLGADGGLAGIISESDLVHRPETDTQADTPWLVALLETEEEAASRISQRFGQQARDVMTRNVVTVDANAPLNQVASLFEKHRVHRVVVTRDGKACGIVARSDLVRALASASLTPSSDQQTDSRVREAILDMFRQLNVHPVYGNVVVLQGVAWLWGAVPSDEVRKSIYSRVSGIPGVRRIEENLTIKPVLPFAF